MQSSIIQIIKNRYKFDGYLYVTGSFMKVSSREEGQRYIDEMTDELTKKFLGIYLIRLGGCYASEEDFDEFLDEYNEYNEFDEEDDDEDEDDYDISLYDGDIEDEIDVDGGWVLLQLEIHNTMYDKIKEKYPNNYTLFSKLFAKFNTFCIEDIMHTPYEAWIGETISKMIDLLLHKFTIDDIIELEEDEFTITDDLTFSIKDKIATSDFSYTMLMKALSKLYEMMSSIENNILHSKNYVTGNVKELYTNGKKGKKKKTCVISSTPYSTMYIYKNGFFT